MAEYFRLDRGSPWHIIDLRKSRYDMMYGLQEYSYCGQALGGAALRTTIPDRVCKKCKKSKEALDG